MGLFSNLLQSLSKGFARTPKLSRVEGNGVWVFVQCNKCGEKISLRIRRTDEIQVAGKDSKNTYFVNKVIMGSKCFNRMDAHLEFDHSYQLIAEDSTVTNGKLITESEYKQNETD